MKWKIWILVPIVYGVFTLWYFNWQGPITAAEVDRYMAAFDEVEGSKHTDSATFRTFLEADDGSEFVMLNQVQLHAGQIAHPLTAKPIGASDLVAEYFEPFALSFLGGVDTRCFKRQLLAATSTVGMPKQMLALD